MLDNLSKNIISTIIYYDTLDYPLTFFEIWKYLIKENNKEACSLADIVMELEENQNLKENISEWRGFYFLKGRKKITEKRIERNKISERKLKIAGRIANFLKFLPFIKMVAVAGRVAMKNAEKKSDIDLFIIIKHGHIFFGRFLITILVHILGKRRYGNKITDRICLNHFISDSYSISIKDLYSSQAYVSLIPIYKPENLKIFFEKNNWIGGYQPNFKNFSRNLKAVKENKFSILIKNVLEKLLSGDYLEKFLKPIQIKKIRKNPATYKKEGMIIYGDSELAFWPDFQNQGPAFFSKFQEKMKNYNFPA